MLNFYQQYPAKYYGAREERNFECLVPADTIFPTRRVKMRSNSAKYLRVFCLMGFNGVWDGGTRKLGFLTHETLKTTFRALFCTGNADIHLVQFRVSFLNLMDKVSTTIGHGHRKQQTVRTLCRMT